MADDLVRVVVTLTRAEAAIASARGNSVHLDAAGWIAKLVRQRIADPHKLTQRQADVLALHGEQLDDRAIAIALGIPKQYVTSTRTRMGLPAHRRQKASA